MLIFFFFGKNLPIAGSESGFWADFGAILPGDRQNTTSKSEANFGLYKIGLRFWSGILAILL